MIFAELEPITYFVLKTRATGNFVLLLSFFIKQYLRDW